MQAHTSGPCQQRTVATLQNRCQASQDSQRGDFMGRGEISVAVRSENLSERTTASVGAGDGPQAGRLAFWCL